MKWIILLGVAALPFLAPDAARSQRRTMTDQQCAAALHDLRSAPHSEAYRQALLYGGVSGCGREGAEVIAHMLRNDARGMQLEDELKVLVGQAAQNRSPLVLDAALAVASDSTQPVVVRKAGLQIAMSQQDVHLWMREMFPMSDAGPSSAVCYQYVLESAWNSEDEMPSDQSERTGSVAEAIASSGSEDAGLRGFARCVAYAVRRVRVPAAPALPIRDSVARPQNPE